MCRSFAAVFTPNPDHPLAWTGFFGFVAMVIGCATAAIGAYAAFSTWRELEPSRRRAQLLPLTILAAVFLAAGLTVVAFGIWLF
ncbi:hypothetical protein ACFYZ8_00815 [Streptomyces sp. NPDC001668]|uniref:hypothetical protein n=1 Tax=unclassified Streptomyces TaxID=2593676 RepID=UPI0036C041F7